MWRTEVKAGETLFDPLFVVARRHRPPIFNLQPQAQPMSTQTSLPLAGKVALVTGGGAGLGLAIAKALVAAGAQLAIAGRRPEPLAAAAAELGGDTLAVPADIGREDQVLALYAAIRARFGRLDILVNNAGFGTEAMADELTLAAWQSVIDTNLTGAFLCAREAMRVMKPQGGGRIINIGSLSARVPRPGGSAYTATKAALDALTRAWALECREHGIAVSILHPGGVDTGFQGGPSTTAHGFAMMDADQVSRAVVLMATLPADINLLDGTILPLTQPYLGRG